MRTSHTVTGSDAPKWLREVAQRMSSARPSEGALLVKPGSHTEERSVRMSGALQAGQLHSGASCECEAILAEAGDVIVFDGDLVHAGGPNLASGIRYALYYRMRWA